MFELSPVNAVDYLRNTGRLPQGTPATARLLAWGVSNVVLRIEPEGAPHFVLKQSRAQLRTAVEWFSRLERVWREADVMRSLAPVMPAGAVPDVLFEDRPNYVFAMQAVPADHVVWKAELLEGLADRTVAARAGQYLATIHAATAGRAELHQQLGDRAIFDELRVDPFFRRIAGVHPDLQPQLSRLIDDCLHRAVCIVHADFSPKNLLIVRNRGDWHRADADPQFLTSATGPVPVPGERAEDLTLTLVDYETGHYGNPAFDLGFFLAHLVLKTVRNADCPSPFLELIRTFLDSYWRSLAASEHPDLQRGLLSRRSVPYFGACLLARIDGKSTIDYLPDSAQHEFVRRFSRRLIVDPPVDLDAAVDELS